MLIDGTVAAKVTNWSFNTSMSPLDTTTLEDTDSNYIHGLRNTTGSCPSVLLRLHHRQPA